MKELQGFKLYIKNNIQKLCNELAGCDIATQLADVIYEKWDCDNLTINVENANEVLELYIKHSNELFEKINKLDDEYYYSFEMQLSKEITNKMKAKNKEKMERELHIKNSKIKQRVIHAMILSSQNKSHTKLLKKYKEVGNAQGVLDILTQYDCCYESDDNAIDTFLEAFEHVFK